MESTAASVDTDLGDYLEFSSQFLAGIIGGTIEPVFASDGRHLTFTDRDRTWEVDLAAGTMTDVSARVQPPASALELELRRRAAPRNIRTAFIPFGINTPVMEIASPDGKLLLGERGPNLAIRAVIDDRQQLLTTDGVEGHEWQVSGAVFWATGAVWSPDSQRVAVIRKDTRNCARLPVVSWLQVDEQVDYLPYVKAGGPLATVTAAVIEVRSGHICDVEIPGDRDQIVAPVGWRHDGTEAYFLTTDRRQKYLRLYAANAVSGTARLVCEETQASFVVGIRDVDRFAPELILADDARLLWFSERDGWRHLYLYRTDGTELGPVTSGPFEVLRVVGVDVDAEIVYFTAHSDRERPYDTHVCRIGLDGSDFRQLTTHSGSHDAILTPPQTHLVVTHSAVDRPPSTDLLEVDGTVVATLSTSDVSELADLRLPTLEPFTALAADGQTELHGVIYLPPDFDPSRSYPVIEYQYGGPQMSVHPVAFTDVLGYFGMAMALATEGFVVYTVDGRGTPGRGKAFQDVVYSRFHEYFVEDHAHVLGQLLGRCPYMDGDRVGIIGASWGGYSTVRTMVLAPELYKVGVAICPVYDLEDQNAFAIEPYMGLPVDRPDAFRAGSSVDMADRLQGKLLMIHGTSDVNATFSATMKMCEGLARADRQYDLVVLPGANHPFTAGGLHHQRYMHAAALRYFVEHLSTNRDVL